MNSTYGFRGSVCAHFGWTCDFLTHGIPWAIVLRMVSDFPGIEYDRDAREPEQLVLTPENADVIEKMLMNN